MPYMMSEEERLEQQAKAIWLSGNGKKIRSWFVRAGCTPVSEFLCGRIWPNIKENNDQG